MSRSIRHQGKSGRLLVPKLCLLLHPSPHAAPFDYDKFHSHDTTCLQIAITSSRTMASSMALKAAMLPLTSPSFGLKKELQFGRHT